MASTPASSIDPRSAALFGAIAHDWWDPDGRSRLLHRVNPVRLAYARQQCGRHFGWDPRALRPARGLTALDIGCGGGLFTEPLARLGFAATGLDAAAEGIAVARAHAAAAGLAVDYLHGSAEMLAAERRRFDLVTLFEVIEHVADVPAFLTATASLVAPGGLLLFSTPNRTPLSYATIIVGAERITRDIPVGGHRWRQFLTPPELTTALAAAGLAVTDLQGIGIGADLRFRLQADTRVNYIGAAVPT